MKIIETYDHINGEAEWQIENSEEERETIATHYNEDRGSYPYFAIRDAMRRLAVYMQWEYVMEDSE